MHKSLNVGGVDGRPMGSVESETTVGGAGNEVLH